jgi:hypothetical protein
LNVDEITIDRSAVNALKSAADAPRAGSLSTWAMLIKRLDEIDPLACPHCGAAMKIVSFIECRQRDVIERILRHCGLWEGRLRTPTSVRGPPGRPSQVPEPRCDLELVLAPEFAAVKAIPSETHRSRELQLVLDPEFLEADPTGGISCERFFRRQPSGALTVRAQITALLPCSPAAVARNPSFLWEGEKAPLKAWLVIRNSGGTASEKWDRQTERAERQGHKDRSKVPKQGQESQTDIPNDSEYPRQRGDVRKKILKKEFLNSEKSF